MEKDESNKLVEHVTELNMNNLDNYEESISLMLNSLLSMVVKSKELKEMIQNPQPDQQKFGVELDVHYKSERLNGFFGFRGGFNSFHYDELSLFDNAIDRKAATDLKPVMGVCLTMQATPTARPKDVNFALTVDDSWLSNYVQKTINNDLLLAALSYRHAGISSIEMKKVLERIGLSNLDLRDALLFWDYESQMVTIDPDIVKRVVSQTKAILNDDSCTEESIFDSMRSHAVLLNRLDDDDDLRITSIKFLTQEQLKMLCGYDQNNDKWSILMDNYDNWVKKGLTALDVRKYLEQV